MAITITASDIKEYTNCNIPDSILNMYVEAVKSKVEDCLNEAYDEPMANLIFLNLVSHIACGSMTGKKTSQSAPNGASISYQTTVSKTGLQSSPYGEQVVMLDMHQCWQNLMAPSFMLEVVGN